MKRIGEEELVRLLRERFRPAHPRILKAIGDDTSVTIEKNGAALLATTDVLIEDTHFRRIYTPARLLGRKSLSISLSDIAAMGGTPLFFLVSIALPPGADRKFIDDLYKGIEEVSEESGVTLLGGNTAKAPLVMVSTTVLGEAMPEEVVYRSGSRPGDIIYVTGWPGESALGLKVLSKHGKKAAVRGPFKTAAKRHLDPTPRLSAGRELAKKRLATAMIDVSDGLLLDLKRLCEESSVSAIVHERLLPVSPVLLRYQALTGKPPLDLVLSGGEDYELLFTARPAASRKVEALFKRLGIPLTRIGEIKKPAKARVALMGESGLIEPKTLGFLHF